MSPLEMLEELEDRMSIDELWNELTQWLPSDTLKEFIFDMNRIYDLNIDFGDDR